MELKDQLCEILLGKHFKDLQQLEQDTIKIYNAIEELPNSVYSINNTKETLFNELMEGPEEKYIDSILDDLEKFFKEEEERIAKDTYRATFMRY